MKNNRNGHQLWENGQCRLCGQPNPLPEWTCPQLKPRLAAKEAKERAELVAMYPGVFGIR